MMGASVLFEDRTRAGRELAGELLGLETAEPIVFALPRGGVPVAAPVARALHARLEVLMVRKLGAPRNRELAVGALAEDGTAIVDTALAARVGLTRKGIEDALERERRELRKRVARFRDDFAPADVRGRTVIVVDDGLATGLSDLVAVRALRARGAGRIVVATPVASPEAVRMLTAEADEVVCLKVPRELLGVGRWYEDFSPVSDGEVLALLAAAGTRLPASAEAEAGSEHSDAGDEPDGREAPDGGDEPDRGDGPDDGGEPSGREHPDGRER
jgi:predicted phosphoribosyltransferase